MKAVIIAYVIIFAVISLVILNSFLVSYNINEVIRLLSSEDTAKEEAEELFAVYDKIYTDYQRRQKFLSISVNHNDLTAIENEFEEILGSAMAGETKNIVIAKSRLLGSLEHLRRLSGINIDSIL